jgi:hypothetical protein
MYADSVVAKQRRGHVHPGTVFIDSEKLAQQYSQGSSGITAQQTDPTTQVL